MKAVLQTPKFQFVKNFARVAFFAFSLMALAAAVKVSAATASDRVFNTAKWSEQEKAMKTPEALVLRDLIAIQYDVTLNRLRSDVETKELTRQRWVNFRKVFCPGVTELCQLSEAADISHISKLLKRDQNLAAINEQLKKLNPKNVQIVRLMAVPGLLPDDMSYLNDFNFLIGLIKPEKSDDGQIYYRVEQSLLVDIGTYYLGYQDPQKSQPNYFAIGHKRQLYIMDETLIAKTIVAAPAWRSLLSADPKEKGFLYFAHRLTKEYAEDKKQERSRYESLKTLAGIEWFIYEEMKSLSIHQGLTLQKSWPVNADPKAQWAAVQQSLLQFQKDFDPRWVSLLFYQHSYDENAIVLEQFTGKSNVNLTITESLNALLDLDGYTATSLKTSWLTSAKTEYVQEEGYSYLKQLNLNLYEILEELNLLNKDWTCLALTNKRDILIGVLYPFNLNRIDKVKDLNSLLQAPKNVNISQINPGGHARLLGMIGAAGKNPLLSHLADQVMQKRFPSL